MPKTCSLLPSIVLALVLMSSWGTAGAQGPPRHLSFNWGSQQKAPEIPADLNWVNRTNRQSLQKTGGKLRLLVFWTNSSISSRHVIPKLNRLAASFPSQLRILGIHSGKFPYEKESKAVEHATNRLGVNFPVLNDPNFEVWQSYGIKLWPAFVFIDPDGNIVGRHDGDDIEPLFERVVSQSIREYQNSGRLKPNAAIGHAKQVQKRSTRTLHYPGSISADPNSERLFISDTNNNRILIVDPDGKVLDQIGSGKKGGDNGDFETAKFRHPHGTFLDGNVLYIADTGNHRIRVANIKTRQVRTIVGTGKQIGNRQFFGAGPKVPLNGPTDVAIYKEKLYFTMSGSHQIWQTELKRLKTMPYAGNGRLNIVDGARTIAQFGQPLGLALRGKSLFVADADTSAIRKLSVSRWHKVDTLFGKSYFEAGDQDGTSKTALLQYPQDVTTDAIHIYVADTFNHKIKRISKNETEIETLTGGAAGFQNGALSQATFREPASLAYLEGKLYCADRANHAIRVIDLKSATVSTLTLHF